MEGVTNVIIALQIGGVAIGAVLLVYLFFKRRKNRDQEDFEERDN